MPRVLGHEIPQFPGWIVGGIEHDGRHVPFLSRANLLDPPVRLFTGHHGHEEIDQDDGIVLGMETFHRLHSVGRRVDQQAGKLRSQHLLEGLPQSFFVVNNQDPVILARNQSHGYAPFPPFDNSGFKIAEDRRKAQFNVVVSGIYLRGTESGAGAAVRAGESLWMPFCG